MKWFEELLKNCYGPVQVQPRAMIGAQPWNEAVDHHKQGTWWHRYEWIDYCLAYKGGTDYSFATIADGKVIALCPIIHEGQTFALGGNPLVPGLLAPNTPGELASASMGIMRNLVNITARHHGVAYADMMIPIVPSGPLKHAPSLECEYDNESIDFSTRVVDLTVPSEKRWKDVRKSYHQLIRRGQEQYTILHHSDGAFSCGPATVYAVLHRDKYGDCRNPRTFDFQNKWVNQGAAHLYFSVHDGKLFGATLWYVCKGLAYYASGVYLRDNVAHVALWESMNDLAERGIKYAELGWQGRAADKKGQAVEFFKRGLGGTDWPVPCLRKTFLTHQEAAS